LNLVPATPSRRGQVSFRIDAPQWVLMPHRSRLRVLLAVAFAAVCPCVAAPLAGASVPRFGHVFLIVGEHTSYEQITTPHAPFLADTIKRRGAWATDYHAFRRSSSLGQYVAMVSGQFARCEAHSDLPDHCHPSARPTCSPSSLLRGARGAIGRSR
jgi:hypothetical protein